MNTTTNDDNNNNINLVEFSHNVKNDGLIIIKKDKIIKKKPKEKLTVDLIYDENIGVFLDADKNTYVCSQTVNEFYKL